MAGRGARARLKINLAATILSHIVHQATANSLLSFYLKSWMSRDRRSPSVTPPHSSRTPYKLLAFTFVQCPRGLPALLDLLNITLGRKEPESLSRRLSALATGFLTLSLGLCSNAVWFCVSEIRRAATRGSLFVWEAPRICVPVHGEPQFRLFFSFPAHQPWR